MCIQQAADQQCGNDRATSMRFSTFPLLIFTGGLIAKYNAPIASSQLVRLNSQRIRLAELSDRSGEDNSSPRLRVLMGSSDPDPRVGSDGRGDQGSDQHLSPGVTTICALCALSSSKPIAIVAIQATLLCLWIAKHGELAAEQQHQPADQKSSEGGA
jgi:hypothetical protein